MPFNIKRIFLFTLSLTFAPLLPAYAEDTQAPPIGTPTVTSQTPIEMTDWGTPKALLAGAHDLILQGDPSRPGLYTIRLSLPKNYVIAPYIQTATTYMTVISGDFHVGVGNKFDASKGKDLPAGSFITIPNNVPTYAWTTADTIVQIHGLGPWNVTYVSQANK